MTKDFNTAYIPTSHVTKPWNAQYHGRAVKNVNRLNNCYLLWTVANTMKMEIDDEMAQRGLNKGEYRRWSNKFEEEFDMFHRALDETLIKEHLHIFRDDYEDLDRHVRDIANLETRTRLCWGRLNTTAFNLSTMATVVSEEIRRIMASNYYYCRKLNLSLYNTSRSWLKWIAALNDSGAMAAKELPIGFEEFATDVFKYINDMIIRHNEEMKSEEEGGQQ